MQQEQAAFQAQWDDTQQQRLQRDQRVSTTRGSTMGNMPLGGGGGTRAPGGSMHVHHLHHVHRQSTETAFFAHLHNQQSPKLAKLAVPAAAAAAAAAAATGDGDQEREDEVGEEDEDDEEQDEDDEEQDEDGDEDEDEEDQEEEDVPCTYDNGFSPYNVLSDSDQSD
jgi:TATA-binding protein-associated factor Taf7